MTNELTVAKEIYRTASQETKESLQKIFGSDAFKTDWRSIKSFEDACEVTGEDPHNSRFTTGSPDTIAYQRIKTIIKAINGDWIPDYANPSQYKWAPWFRYDPSISGFRFHDSIYVRVATSSAGGSRLCYRNSDICEFAGKHFLSLYKEMMIFSK
jgi:hypothetical protein